MKQPKSSTSSGSARSPKKMAANETAMNARDRIEPRKPAQPMMQRDQHGSAARGRNTPKPKGSGPRSKRASG